MREGWEREAQVRYRCMVRCSIGRALGVKGGGDTQSPMATGRPVGAQDGATIKGQSQDGAPKKGSSIRWQPIKGRSQTGTQIKGRS
eukprot:6214317-Pleurochrysis_carterae.AAC.1